MMIREKDVHTSAGREKKEQNKTKKNIYKFEFVGGEFLLNDRKVLIIKKNHNEIFASGKRCSQIALCL